ncbi:unnamed protein product [Soboliphyme baturini]|uniref:Tetraspanin n=1 Tax=Soboliphyme baturini TaxID=241478 RepID=A0A183J175_9BILA|nr:unnamed protein product [Soboliphyme baturini]
MIIPLMRPITFVMGICLITTGTCITSIGKQEWYSCRDYVQLSSAILTGPALLLFGVNLVLCSVFGMHDWVKLSNSALLIGVAMFSAVINSIIGIRCESNEKYWTGSLNEKCNMVSNMIGPSCRLSKQELLLRSTDPSFIQMRDRAVENKNLYFCGSFLSLMLCVWMWYCATAAAREEALQRTIERENVVFVIAQNPRVKNGARANQVSRAAGAVENNF